MRLSHALSILTLALVALPKGHGLDSIANALSLRAPPGAPGNGIGGIVPGDGAGGPGLVSPPPAAPTTNSGLSSPNGQAR